jgi:hypothetical protein
METIASPVFNGRKKIFLHIKYEKKEHIYIVYDENSFIIGEANTYKKASKIAHKYIEQTP